MRSLALAVEQGGHHAIYVVVFVFVVCLLLYFLLRELVQYRQDNNHLDCDDVALVTRVTFYRVNKCRACVHTIDGVPRIAPCVPCILYVRRCT